jgi:hypothetical protein
MSPPKRPADPWRPQEKGPADRGALVILACWLSSARAVTTDPGGAVIIGQHSRDREHRAIMPAITGIDKG